MIPKDLQEWALQEKAVKEQALQEKPTQKILRTQQDNARPTTAGSYGMLQRVTPQYTDNCFFREAAQNIASQLGKIPGTNLTSMNCREKLQQQEITKSRAQPGLDCELPTSPQTLKLVTWPWFVDAL